MISRDIALSKITGAQAGEASGLASAVPSGNNFQSILKNVISGTPGAASSATALSSITQEQLTLLIRALHIQMNSRLYNTVFNNGLEANYLASQVIQKYGSHIAENGTQASNNRHLLPKKMPVGTDQNLEQIIQEAASQFDVEANLIRSVVKVESNSNPNATSQKGAMGLMQLMPDTARELGVKNAYDARENIMGGARYLKMLLNRYNGQVDLALAAYNWGMGNLEKRPHNLPQETLDYVAKVNSYYKGA